MKKILLTDDHPTIRSGVRKILEKNMSNVSIEEASNGAEALQRLMKNDIDLMILDIDMPGRSGLDVLRDLKDGKGKTKVLLFSMHPEEQIAIRAFRLGAFGYLAKNADESTIMKAVETILSGKRYITPHVAERMLEVLENPEMNAPHDALSEREFQTMKLIASGKTVSDIADELSLSVTTVSTYRARILEKLGLNNTAEIVNYAFRNNLI